MCVCALHTSYNGHKIHRSSYAHRTSTLPLIEKHNCISVHIQAHRVIIVIPVHFELSGNPVKAQSHKRHMCDALISA